MNRWIIKARETVFQRRFFSLVKNSCYHPDKEINFDFYTISTSDWINIVARTTTGKILLVEQHRLGTDTITLETPGGVIEQGEETCSCALRELREETGYAPEEIHLLKKCAANPAIQGNYIYFYYAHNCTLAGDQELDGTEDINVHSFTYTELVDMIRHGNIDHSIVITALSLFRMSPFFQE